MSTETSTLIGEADTLGLFKPHGAFEVHCSHCHARLNGMGDCDTCGLIGRPSDDLVKRADIDPEGVHSLLRRSISKRGAYKPSGRAER